MKIVFTHTDFRIYWPARLETLHKYLTDKNIELQVIEIAGQGSPYGFALDNPHKPAYWHCLFPERPMEEIPATIANNAVQKKLDEMQPDIVFSGAIAFPSGAASVHWTQKNNKKLVIFDDARLQDVPRKPYVDYIKKSIYSGVDGIFCPAPAWNSTFRYFGFTEHQLFYGINSVDNNFWSGAGKGLYRSDTDKNFVAVGRQIAKKNFDTLLLAYAEYCLTNSNPLPLLMVGEGKERDKLKDFAVENKLELVKFLPFQSQDELRNIFYNDAAWLILPSKRETWGLVVNEAMASGLPVLVSNQVGCASTLVKEGVNGFTFSPDNVEELAELLTKAGSMNKTKLADMGRKSKDIISEWGLERFCEGVHGAIKCVTGNKKRRLSIFGRIMIRFWKGRYRPV